jgi:hypothetical protein
MMKDRSEYVVKTGRKFFIDTYDLETGEPVFVKGEAFSFVWDGVPYKGIARSDEGEMVPILLVP